MEAMMKEEMGNINKEGNGKKRKRGSMILNFLMYGGWLLVAVVVLVILILISTLGK